MACPGAERILKDANPDERENVGSGRWAPRGKAMNRVTSIYGVMDDGECIRADCTLERDYGNIQAARLACDLHNGVNQLIIGAMFEVTAARERLRENDLEAVDRSLDQVRTILAQVDEELRRTIMGIRPPTLDDLGLDQSITRYVEQFQAQTGISTITMRIPIPRPMENHDAH